MAQVAKRPTKDTKTITIRLPPDEISLRLTYVSWTRKKATEAKERKKIDNT